MISADPHILIGYKQPHFDRSKIPASELASFLARASISTISNPKTGHLSILADDSQEYDRKTIISNC